MNGVKIDFKKETKQLGFNLKNEGHLYYFNNIINDMYIRTNAILTNFNKLSTNVKVELFNKQCMSLYGCVLWDFLDKQVDKLEVGWRKCCRNIMSLSPLMNTSCIRTIIENRFINFLIDGVNSRSSLIKFIFRNSLTTPSKLVRNLNIVLYKHRINYSRIFNGRKIRVNDQNCVDKWRLDMIRELLCMRDFNEINILNKNEIQNILNYLCTA